MKKNLLFILLAGWTGASFAQNIPIYETAPLSAGLQYFGSAQLSDGDVIVFGGTNSFPNAGNTTWRYDWQTETWSQLSNMAFASAQMATATLSTGDILAVGGTNNFSGKVQKSQLFDVSEMQWVESAGNFEFFNPIYTTHSVLTLPGDYVLLTTSNGDFSIYNPMMKTWSNQDAPAPLDAGGSPVVWLDTQQEVLFTGAGGQIFQPTVPPTSGNLFYLDPPQELYQDGVTKLANGKVLTMDLELNFDNTVTLYDPVTRTANAVTTVPFNGGVNSRSAILMADGRVLTFGFGDITQPGNTKVIEVYDTATNTWSTGAYSEMGPLGAPHLHLLPDSSIFAVSTVPQAGENKTWILNRDDMTDTGEEQQLSIEISPNPASDFLLINGLNGTTANFSLFRLDGALAARWKQVSNQIFLRNENLPAGMYFYSLNSPDGQMLSAGKIIFQFQKF